MSTSVADDPVIQRFREKLNRVYGDRIERVVLFGSRARGDHREDSDYDVGVFLRHYDERWFDEVFRLAAITTDVLWETGGYVSAKPFLGPAIDRRTGFMAEVRRTGRELPA